MQELNQLAFNLDGFYSIKAGIKTVTRRPKREKIPKFKNDEIVSVIVLNKNNTVVTGLELKIKSITEENLQDISDLECLLEGVKKPFNEVWEDLPYESPFTWDENPRVWRIEFERV